MNLSSTAHTRAGLTLTCGKDNILRLVDSRTFQVKQMLTAPGFAIGTIWCTVCLSADEAHAAAGSANGSVYVWEVHLAFQCAGLA